jgi:hypothetical protein
MLVALCLSALLLGRSTGAVAGQPSAVAGPAEVVKAAGFGHFRGDVRHIAPGQVRRADKRPEPLEPSDTLPRVAVDDTAVQDTTAVTAGTTGVSFDGLNHNAWGAGYPPDVNGDVGPNHYVETVNTSIGIWNKSGARLAALTFDSLFSSAGTGTPCDNSNQGDPVALYDPFGDRFIVSDFAWNDAQMSTGPFYQCFAVSKTGDPVNGGWYFYAFKVESGASLPDYPKLGVWPDGIYMSANVFASSGSQSFQNPQVWAFNRAQMEAGDPNAQGVTFAVARTVGGISTFSLLPSNARSVTGAPPAGAPNYFASIWGAYAIRVWKFHVDWANPASSTFTGPTNVGVATFNVGPSTVPEKGGNPLDTLSYRLMMQNQYTNLGGHESLWLTHTVGSSSNVAQVRWYELPVTGGVISGVRQQSTFAPDSKNRFMPSLAVDKNGDMAVGYSVSDSTIYPAIRYAARLSTDGLSTLGQGETELQTGLGFQCCKFSDGSLVTRWGDYTAMTIDPDGCTFWYAGEYYANQPTTKEQDDWRTRISSFQLPGCSGTVAQPPGVTSFAPTSGTAGTSVTVTGSNFTGATTVAFNGTAATFSVDSASQITATVPAGATSGPISVTTGGGTGPSASSFTVTTVPAAPVVSGFSPTSGPVGTGVTVTGSGFTGATSVRFNGTVAAFTAVSASQISATVPAGATSGPISVTTPDGTGTSAGSFTVTVVASQPAITSFSPTSGRTGTSVTITGTGFTGANRVRFGNKNASFTVNSPTQITATVPGGAKTGKISVTTPAGTATSSATFTVTR